MVRKNSLFLVFVFALNVALSSVSFNYSVAFAKEKTNFEKQEEAKSAFQKAVELVAKPFAYVFHKIYFKFLGPPELGMDYHIFATLEFQLKDKKFQELVSKINDPVRHKKITAKEWVMYNAYTNSKEYIENKERHITLYLPTVLYKGKKQKIPTNNFSGLSGHYGKPQYRARVISTKFGEMIEVWEIGTVGGYIDIKGAGVFSQKIYRVFPYALSTEFDLNYEERISDGKTESGKGFQETGKKIATYLYVFWKGKAQLKLDFWIGAGANFGYAGSNGLGYSFCKEQPDKTVQFQEFRGRNYLERNLIFKKPGWYKICMEKEDYISAL